MKNFHTLRSKHVCFAFKTYMLCLQNICVLKKVVSGCVFLLYVEGIGKQGLL